MWETPTELTVSPDTQGEIFIAPVMSVRRTEAKDPSPTKKSKIGASGNEPSGSEQDSEGDSQEIDETIDEDTEHDTDDPTTFFAQKTFSAVAGTDTRGRVQNPDSGKLPRPTTRRTSRFSLARVKKPRYPARQVQKN